MKTMIHSILPQSMPIFPCWLWLPECQEWQWFNTTLGVDYLLNGVCTHWSLGGRPAAPIEKPQ